YLRRSALGDLRNRRSRERKHHRLRVAMEEVADRPDAWKYLGREDDLEGGPAGALDELARHLDERERKVVGLMRAGVRGTAAFGRVLGLTGLPPEEQARAVKRVKDRIKKRLRRAGGES